MSDAEMCRIPQKQKSQAGAGLARMKKVLGAYTAAQITPPRVLYEYNASATVIVIHLSH